MSKADLTQELTNLVWSRNQPSESIVHTNEDVGYYHCRSCTFYQAYKQLPCIRINCSIESVIGAMNISFSLQDEQRSTLKVSNLRKVAPYKKALKCSPIFVRTHGVRILIPKTSISTLSRGPSIPLALCL